MWDSRWLTGLERVILALFVLALAGFLVRLAGWRPDWLLTAYQLCAVAFALTLLTYLNVGGFQRVAKSKVGTVGLVLLALALIQNIADVLFGIDSPVWEIAGNTIATAFLACFVAFVVIRLTQTTRSRDSAR